MSRYQLGVIADRFDLNVAKVRIVFDERIIEVTLSNCEVLVSQLGKLARQTIRQPDWWLIWSHFQLPGVLSTTSFFDMGWALHSLNEAGSKISFGLADL